MAYNSNNHKKKVQQIIGIYLGVKEHDVPDTYIVKHILPKHNVFISYRTLMNLKRVKVPLREQENPAQLCLY